MPVETDASTGSYDAGCVFCRIAAGGVSGGGVSGISGGGDSGAGGPIVYEDSDTIAFLDHRPVFKGHVLVCPRDHVITLPDLATNRLAHYFSVVQLVARVLPLALGAQGTFVAQNNVVSQSVPHLHVHVVPRTKGDGLRGFFWPRTKYAEGEVDEYAQRISAALETRAPD